MPRMEESLKDMKAWCNHQCSGCYHGHPHNITSNCFDDCYEHMDGDARCCIIPKTTNDGHALGKSVHP